MLRLHYSVILIAICFRGATQQVIPLYMHGMANERNNAMREDSLVWDGSFGGLRNVAHPTLQLFLPPPEKATGYAVIICPGGGYAVEAYRDEGIAIARHLAQNGIAGLVLKYRLPSDSTMIDKSIGPLQDAQQALKTVREQAARWHIRSDRIGIMGFSAGGHLAATAATHFDKNYLPNPEGTSLRPDFMVLVYPLISMQDSLTHTSSRRFLLGKTPKPEAIRFFSNELQVTPRTPRTWLTHTGDDGVVSVKNSLVFYQALLAQGVEAEMHLYPRGDHGFVLAFPPEQWMAPLLQWILNPADTAKPASLTAVKAEVKIGPGGGGATFIPTYSYHSNRRFLLRCDMTGSYVTQDGGDSYRQINFPNGAVSFAFDPFLAEVAYAGGESGLWKSTDTANHWTRLLPAAADVVATAFSGDHAEYQLHTKPGSVFHPANGRITAIRVDPVVPNNLYAAAGKSFYYSETSGNEWKRKDLPGTIGYVYTNSNSLRQSVVLFTPDSLFWFNKSSGEMAAQALPAAMQPAFSFAAGTTKKDGRTIFYALHAGEGDVGKPGFTATEIWVSYDCGKQWHKATSPVNGSLPSLTMISCAERDAEQAYAIANMVQEQGVGGKTQFWYGAFKTADAALSWKWVWKGGGGSGEYGVPDASDAANLRDAWVQQAFGKEFIQLFDVGVAPNSGDTAIVTDWYRSMQTTDGGQHWREIYSMPAANGAYRSRGLDVTTAYGVHFDPFDKRHLGISYTDIGYHHSYDGGKSWSRSVNGIPVEWVNTCYSVVFDPAVRHKLWSAWSGLHDFPRGKMTRDPRWREYARGGIARSADGGRSWQPVVNGMGEDAAATSIIIDPRSPANKRTLYATVFNKGVFKSTDDGNHWQRMNNGLDSNTCAFEITLAANGYLYLVVSPTPVHENAVTQPRILPGAVYRSIDAAAHWQKLTVSAAAGFFPNGIEVDPFDPAKIYLACWAPVSMGDLLGRVAKQQGVDTLIAAPGGVFVSTDAGDHWQQVFDSSAHVYDVTADPSRRGRLYINTFNKAAYQSDDGGRHWVSMKDYDFHWGHRVVIDPRDHDKLYFTTFGSSVWQGQPVPRPQK